MAVLRLDPGTLLLVSFATTFLVGMLFLLSWRQAPGSRALALWGAAHISGAVASAGLSLRGQIPDVVSIGLANAVMLGAYGLIWSGVRAFQGLPLRLGGALAGAIGWSLLCLVPAFYGSLDARILFASTGAALYCAASAVTIRRSRSEHLASRAPAALLLALHGCFYAVRIPATLFMPPPAGANPLAFPWMATLCFAAMLFSIATAFTFMALVKERAEREQRIAARTDPLTGVANRRAFVEEAHAALVGRLPALLLFDLDHFKGINDTYGHAVGDAVLVGFCEMAEAMLPRGALLGRLGGEEFGCLLPDVSPEAARGQAERLRVAFAGLGVPNFPDLRLSVSIGVAPAGDTRDFETLMRRADAALYAAKNNGRDRVEVAFAQAARPGALGDASASAFTQGWAIAGRPPGDPPWTTPPASTASKCA